MMGDYSLLEGGGERSQAASADSAPTRCDISALSGHRDLCLGCLGHSQEVESIDNQPSWSILKPDLPPKRHLSGMFVLSNLRPSNRRFASVRAARCWPRRARGRPNRASWRSRRARGSGWERAKFPAWLALEVGWWATSDILCSPSTSPGSQELPRNDTQTMARPNGWTVLKVWSPSA